MLTKRIIITPFFHSLKQTTHFIHINFASAKLRLESALCLGLQMFFARKRSGSGTDAGQLAVIAWMRWF